MPYGTVNADVIGTSVANSNLGAGNATLLKNRLIDAGFIINQRGYVSGTALSAGTYAHDRWKAGASGCTYTFTQGSLGVPIVITITAGSLQQIIEGCNMPDGGTYVLSWTGTAQARFNGGTYGSSPLAVTGITAGANTTIEFNTGTCSFPQLEVGSSATGFEYVNYQTSLANCQRYFNKLNLTDGAGPIGFNDASTKALIMYYYPVTMRANPVVETTGTASNYAIRYTGSTVNLTVVPSFESGSKEFARIAATTGGSLTAGQAVFLVGNTGSTPLSFQAEL